MKPPYNCCFGEILWDIFPSKKLPGGAPMNVATHLQNLGLPTYMISCVGNDELGNEIKKFLTSVNCSTKFIQTHSSLPTGVVKVTLSENLNASYEIIQPSSWDFITINEEILEVVKNADSFIFGTLSCRNEQSLATLLQLLDVAKLKIYDVNFRTPFYSKELVETLLKHADIVKINDDELVIIKKWYNLEQLSDKETLNDLAQKFNLKLLIVTLGSEGAMVFHPQDGLYKTNGIKVEVADTIGCGDSFLAGFLKNYLAQKNIQYSLNYAAALGALVATHHGATPRIEEVEIEEMMSKITEK